MPKTGRPSPESFLAQVEQEAGRPAGGRLKVFFGFAPGVGKTYSMLQAARGKKAEGEDIVVGLVETHGRAETEALLEGLELLPRRLVDYHGVKLSEFDLDGALARKPSIILIDVLAHTNAPGSRHSKRWQDVAELLARGFDVYSTLNVQHLESLNDIVAQITGVTVHETVPDSILEKADVALVDLPPGELIDRLKDGKVYVPQLASRAIENYFRVSNLSALRELALRTTAEGVNAVVQSQRQQVAPEAIWPTTERILVCVGPGPQSARLVRGARRMATGLRAEWIALFVDCSRQALSANERASAIEHLRMAERLGAEIVTLGATDMVEGIFDFARQRNVTKIVVGKQRRPRWREWLRRSIVDEIIRASGDIEVYVITGDPGLSSISVPAMGAPMPVPWWDWALAAAVVAVCTAACFAMYPFLALTNLVMVYLLGTLIVALRGHRWVAVIASFLSVLAFDFFFVPPRFSLAVTDTQYFFTFLVMLSVALTISHLAVRARLQTEASRLGEMRAATLHALSRKLASTRGVPAILDVAVRHVAEVFAADVLALMAGKDGRLETRAASAQRRDLDEKERSVAQWVFDLGQPAGQGTQTLPVVDALYAPLLGGEGTVGVLRLQPLARERRLVADEMLLLESFAHQIALALEVDRLQENARRAEVSAETERLRSSLLSSVSHDLRTPLAAIIGSATSLLQSGREAAAAETRELLENILGEAERLARLVHNLIETTRLETGGVRLKKEPQSIEEVAGAALERMEKTLGDRPVKSDIPEDLPMVPLDAVLMEQVFFNLIENATRHTPAGTPIEIAARVDGDSMEVEVADRGPGLAQEDIDRVFEKFYRAKSSGPGAGLGLAICKAVIQAHGGRIWAENRPGGGASFRFQVPLHGA